MEKHSSNVVTQQMVNKDIKERDGEQRQKKKELFK